MKRTYLRFIQILTLAENFVCASGLVLVTFMTFVQVLNRYWLHYEIMWLPDLTLYIFISIVFFIISTTAREDSHTVVDILEAHAFNGPLSNPAYKICAGLCSLAILITALPIFYTYLRNAIRYPEYGTLVRWFNTSWLIMFMFGMLILSIFHTIHNIGANVLAFGAALQGKNNKNAIKEEVMK